jgi:hypothetical protein
MTYEPTNEQKLKDAGVIKSNKNLTPEQSEAIESLSEAEVDGLIAVNEQLAEQIESNDTLLDMPGRIANNKQSQGS